MPQRAQRPPSYVGWSGWLKAAHSPQNALLSSDLQPILDPWGHLVFVPIKNVSKVNWSVAFIRELNVRGGAFVVLQLLTSVVFLHFLTHKGSCQAELCVWIGNLSRSIPSSALTASTEISFSCLWPCIRQTVTVRRCASNIHPSTCLYQLLPALRTAGVLVQRQLQTKSLGENEQVNKYPTIFLYQVVSNDCNINKSGKKTVFFILQILIYALLRFKPTFFFLVCA